MRKIIGFFNIVSIIAFGLLITLPITTGSAAAYTFGQSHAYDVRLRGNGSAVVNARITLNNNEKSAQTTYRYTNQSGTLSDISALQQISCSILPYYAPSLKQLSPTKDSAEIEGHKAVATTAVPECYPSMRSKATIGTGTTQQTIDYFAPNYDYVYKHLSVKQTGNNFALALASPIEPDDSATVVLIYDLANVAQKKLGAFNYNFKTLKSTDRTNDVSVALSVEDGYVLDGASNQKTNYKSDTGASALSLGSSATMNASQESAATTYIAGIGDNGQVTEQASTLAAGETLTVTGKYASSSFLLHWPRTALIWGVIALIIITLIVLYRRRRKQLKQKRGEQHIDIEPANSTIEPDSLVTDNNELIPEAKDTSSEAEGENTIQTATAHPEYGVSASSTATSPRFISVDLEALPFYEYIARCLQAFRSRRVSPVIFGWLCGLSALVYVGVFTLGYMGIMALSSNWYSYDTGLLNAGLYWAMLVCLSLALGIGLLVICVAVPILYAPNLKTAIRIACNMIGFLIAIGLIFALLSSVLKPDEPKYYPYDDMCNSTMCSTIQ